MKKRGLMLLVVMMMLLSLMPSVRAQDEDGLTDDELALVNYVSDAMDKVSGMTSVYIDGTQAVMQDIRAEGQTINQTITQDITGWTLNENMLPVAMDITAIQAIQTSSNPGQDIELALSMDMRFLDDVLYMRVYDLPRDLAGAGLYPDGWANLAEVADRYQGFQFLNVDQLSNIAASTGVTNIYNENTVISIEELENETLEDGTEVRVFSVELDAIAVMQDETTANAMGVLNFDSLGIDVETFMQDMMDSASYFVTVQVNAETDIVLQIDILMNIVAEITLQGISVDLIQDMIATFNYSRFNEDIEIVVPDLSDA